MPVYYNLDKIITAGAEWVMAADEFLLISAIGTNSSGAGRLMIERQLTGDIKELVSPLHKRSTNFLGLLELGDLYYVVPNQKRIKFEGDTGSKCRIKGRIGVLAPGESVPATHLARAANQDIDFLCFVEGSVSLGTDEVWADGRELDVYTLTPKTIERYDFQDVVMTSVTGDTITEGQVGIRFYLEGKPLDNLAKANLPLGVDALSMPRPPAEGTDFEPFSLKELPIVVEGDKTIKITAINISGGSLTPATGSKWTVTVTAIVRYRTKR